MNDFEHFLRSLALRPNAIAADGRIRRCATEDHPRKRNGAYMLAVDGAFGWGQNHATMQAPAIWHPKVKIEAPPFNPRELREERERARRSLIHATIAARRFWTKCQPLRATSTLHPYLAAHGVDMTGCEQLRIDSNGWLVIPIIRNRYLISYQRISPDGTKLFAKGCSVRGGSYRINRAGSTMLALVEGLATGLTVYKCLPQCSVIIAFNAGNMARVAETLPKTGWLVVCADNDSGTEARLGANPGIEAAQAAADILGCGLAIPYCESGTDFCDLRNERIRAVLEAWNRPPHQTDLAVRRAIDAGLKAEIMKAATFVEAVVCR